MKIRIILLLLIFFNIIFFNFASNDPIILIHGYNKSKKDMIPLKINLIEMNYKVHLVDLPLTKKKFNYAYKIFKKKFKNITEKYPKNTKYHFIGHSTGGLIIRKYFKSPLKGIKIGRSIQIATPNKGSELADISFKYLGIFFSKYRTLKSIRKKNIENLKLPDELPVEIGAITGKKSNSIYSFFIDGKDDGRVAVKSVKFKGLKDFIILPYTHKEIHHQKKTAKLIDNFFQKGKF